MHILFSITEKNQNHGYGDHWTRQFPVSKVEVTFIVQYNCQSDCSFITWFKIMARFLIIIFLASLHWMHFVSFNVFYSMLFETDELIKVVQSWLSSYSKSNLNNRKLHIFYGYSQQKASMVFFKVWMWLYFPCTKLFQWMYLCYCRK